MPSSETNFGWMFGLLSAVMSALAIVALARHAFATWSLSAPMVLIMDAYNAVMQVLFGWAQPYLQAALSWLGSFIGWRPTLYPHWRDALVLMLLWVRGYDRGRYTRRFDGWQARPVIATLLENLSAFVAALMVGTLPLQSGDLVTQLLIASLPPMLLVFTYQATPAFWADSPIRIVARAMLFALLPGALAAGWVFLLVIVLGRASNAGLGIFGLVLWALTQTFLSLGHSPRVRLTVLTGFLGAFAFFVIDAGLKLVMG
jgi:hypothetical protein